MPRVTWVTWALGMPLRTCRLRWAGVGNAIFLPTAILGETGLMGSRQLVLRTPGPCRPAAFVTLLCLQGSSCPPSAPRTRASIVPFYSFKNTFFSGRDLTSVSLTHIGVNLRDALISSRLSDCEGRTVWSRYRKFPVLTKRMRASSVAWKNLPTL